MYSTLAAVFAGGSESTYSSVLDELISSCLTPLISGVSFDVLPICFRHVGQIPSMSEYVCYSNTTLTSCESACN